MIHAVRLRPFNRKKGHGMKDYKSAACGNTYRIGKGNQPSPFYIVGDKNELNELREFSQFEIIPFDNKEELEAFIEKETQASIRAGHNVIAPRVERVKARKKPANDTIPTVDQVFGGPGVNNGRKPAMVTPEVIPEEEQNVEPEADDIDEDDAVTGDTNDEYISELEIELRNAEDRLSEAQSKGRTKRTIDKWTERVNEAREDLEKAKRLRELG